MSKKFLTNLDLNQNELQNAKVQNVATLPSSAVVGQMCYKTGTNAGLYTYNGTDWEKGGKDYTFTNGLSESSGTVSVNFATTAEVTTGTIENKAVNPKELATKLTGYVVKNSDITAGTKAKITYDAKGLVTGGADLSASDIPNLTLSKITDVTATATELNYVDGVTSNIQTQLDAKASSSDLTSHTSNTSNPHSVTKTQVGLGNVTDDAQVKRSEMGVASGVATLDSGAKIPTSQIPDVLLGQLVYGGTVATGVVATLTENAKTKLGTSSSTITLTNDTTAITGYEANEGIFYILENDITFAGISFLVGDWLLSTGSAWKKIDNTDAVTGVKGDSESTYRIGNVNITKDNIGLGNVSNTAITVSSSSVTSSDGTTTTTYNASDKMDKANPTGTGYFSLNRHENTTVGDKSFAEGYNCTASGSYSHAEGWNTTASGMQSHSEGYFTTASDNGAHAEGRETNASNTGAHAEGGSTTASGQYSHSEGYSTTASGGGAHTEGALTTASGNYSHAEGVGTTAQRKSQHTFGEYNILDTGGTTSSKGTYVEIVGNGSSNDARSNARTLDWSGNEILSGTSQATGFKTASGTSSQFLKADGSVDSTSYQPTLTAGTNITIENNVISASTAGALKYSATNPALTTSGGICTWTIAHGLNMSDVIVQVLEVSTNQVVIPDIEISSASQVLVKINSSADISAGVYKVIILG